MSEPTPSKIWPIDNIGFIELVDHMGDDLMVVNAARVSYDRTSSWESQYVTGWSENAGDEQVPNGYALYESDQKLIHYLVSHGHWSPFGHPQISVRIRMPIFVARQWMRSNVGIIYNEVSRRYVDDEPEFYVPVANEWRYKPESGKSKQGSSDNTFSINTGFDFSNTIQQYHERGTMLYKWLLERGVAPEQAREHLGINMYTELIMTASLMAMARVYRDRISPLAQKEIQQYAKALGDIIQPLFPVSWKELTSVTA